MNAISIIPAGRSLLMGLVFFLLAIAIQAQSPVRILTYNIRYDNPGDGVNQWGNRKDKVAELLKKYDPDVFGVQEALSSQVNDLLVLLPDYAYYGLGRDDGKTTGEYSAIFYKKEKFILVQNGTFWLSPSPDVPGSKGWDAAITRLCTWVLVKERETEKTFFVFNTHFDHIGEVARGQTAFY